MKPFLALFVLLSCAACQGEANVSQPEQTATVVSAKPQQQEAKMITVTGVIVYKNMEGGFYALDAHDGKKYQPWGLDKALLQNGMEVEVVGEIVDDMATMQQYGQVLKVKSAKMIDDSKVSVPASNEF